MKIRRPWVLTFLAGILPLAGCAQPVPLPAPPRPSAATPADLPGLHNVVAFAPRVYSGSVPGPGGFETLYGLGVRTVVSVDGARPDVSAARSAGLRYVHLPIGYDGMDRERTLQIARAVELGLASGAVYVHCHHGKHRSGGAAGAAAVTLGLLTPGEAKGRLEVSGTSPHYPGLYECVAAAEPASPGELAAAGSDLPEVWETSGLVQAMVEIDEAADALKVLGAAGWAAPETHPDLVPAAEAGRLADLFRTLDEDEEVAAESEDFRAQVAAAQRLASELEEAVVEGEAPGELARRFAEVKRSCKDCHRAYRDR